MDYFFAQCEERENPSLRGRPVVVCVYSGRGPHSGVVSTANYMARGFGVKSGMPISFAERALKDKDAVFIPVNHKLYGKVSESVMKILHGYADSFEQVSIDESFLDITSRVSGDFEAAGRLALKIKKDVMAKERLTCSVGIGPNKLVAKIASDFQKPDGLMVVKPEEIRSFLHPLPVRKLYGVGRKIEKKMKDLGIVTVGNLAEFDVVKLTDVFGKRSGVYFHRAAKGIDEEPVQEREEAKQISRIVTLKRDTREMNLLTRELDEVSQVVHARIVDKNLKFTSIGVIAIMENLSVHTRTKTLETSTDDLDVIREVSRKLLEVLLREKTELDIRRIGVRVSNLIEDDRQKSLSEF